MRGSSNAQADLSSKQDTLTFDTVPTANSANPITSGGVYAALESAGGGEVWEEVDLNNWPTDWVSGDRIKAIFNFTFSLSNPSSWTTAPSRIEIRTTSTIAKSNVVVEIRLDDTAIFGEIPIISVTNEDYVVLHSCKINSLASFNTTPFSLVLFMFNGGGSVTATLTLTPDNISDYVYKMWRLKQ